MRRGRRRRLFASLNDHAYLFRAFLVRDGNVSRSEHRASTLRPRARIGEISNSESWRLKNNFPVDNIDFEGR